MSDGPCAPAFYSRRREDQREAMVRAKYSSGGILAAAVGVHGAILEITSASVAGQSTPMVMGRRQRTPAADEVLLRWSVARKYSVGGVLQLTGKYCS